MIEAAALSVVMENAEEILKKKADFLTRANGQDGVAYAIRKWIRGE